MFKKLKKFVGGSSAHSSGRSPTSSSVEGVGSGASSIEPVSNISTDSASESKPSRPKHPSHDFAGMLDKHLCEKDFEVVRSIGQGSFGKVTLVRKAIDPSGAHYAMKIVPKDCQSKANSRTFDLFTEMYVLARIQHPFIIRLVCAFEDKHSLHFVLEYMEGGTLSEVLARLPGHRLSEEQARFYSAEVFLALRYLHDNRIIYRDVKPSNILLDRAGHICLADMGLCKDFDHSAEADTPKGRPIRTKSIVGSALYIAPDILRRSSYSIAVDWWSFGVLVFQMVSGTLPFHAADDVHLMVAIMVCPPDFNRLPLGTSPILKDLLIRLLKKHEEDRLSEMEIENHPFYSNMDWNALLAKAIPPPGFCPPPTPHYSPAMVGGQSPLHVSVPTSPLPLGLNSLVPPILSPPSLSASSSHPPPAGGYCAPGSPTVPTNGVTGSSPYDYTRSPRPPLFPYTPPPPLHPCLPPPSPLQLSGSSSCPKAAPTSVSVRSPEISPSTHPHPQYLPLPPPLPSLPQRGSNLSLSSQGNTSPSQLPKSPPLAYARPPSRSSVHSPATSSRGVDGNSAMSDVKSYPPPVLGAASATGVDPHQSNISPTRSYPSCLTTSFQQRPPAELLPDTFPATPSHHSDTIYV